MKPYTVFYTEEGKEEVFSNVWDADTLDDAIDDARYHLENRLDKNYKVSEEKTRECKENQY